MAEEVVVFAGHAAHIAAVARQCRDSGLFTDVVLVCEDGRLSVHRIVLAAISPFLRCLLSSQPEQVGEVTLLLPQIKQSVLAILMEFLYTGTMQLSEYNSWRVQELVLLLQVDPQNVVVEVTKQETKPHVNHNISSTPTVGEIPQISTPLSKPSRPTASPLSVQTVTLRDPEDSDDDQEENSEDEEDRRQSSVYDFPASSPDSHQRRHHNSSTPSPRLRTRAASGRASLDSNSSQPGDYMAVLRPSGNSNVIKIVNSRKRRLSSLQDNSQSHHHIAKEGRLGEGGGSSNSSGTRGRSRGAVTPRGRARSRGAGSPRVRRTNPGMHDMENMETWVCAICGQYDPVLLPLDGSNTTEWIGCDCNRWFHKLCTRLKVVDDNFCCQLVHKTCLPP